MKGTIYNQNGPTWHYFKRRPLALMMVRLACFAHGWLKVVRRLPALHWVLLSKTMAR